MGDMSTQAVIPTLDTFGARLAAVRHLRGWNQKEAALACGVPYSSWRAWELEGTRPRDVVTICQAIATHTGVDGLWLLTGSREGLPREDSNLQQTGYEPGTWLPIAA